MFDRLKSLLGTTPQRDTPAVAEAVGQPSPYAGSKPRHPETSTIAPMVRTATGITFPVDDVQPATSPLWLGTLGESLEIRADASILIMPDQALPAAAAEGYVENSVVGEPRRPLRTAMRALSLPGTSSVSRQLARSQTFLHPLVQAVHLAFSDHRPLVLTPDCIWLTIVQGFGQHVNENAEALRGRIVHHEGKKELCVPTMSLDPACWPALISGFSTKIKNNSDPVLHETLLCQFSTTTPTIKTACEIALMDTYQRYFDYRLMCLCGIPTITLEGTVEDWQRMRDRIEVLATFDLGWWTSKLAPILDQFVATAQGNPDRAFWQAIYKPQKVYVTEMATGWITDLFPYLFGAPKGMGGSGRGLCDSAAAQRNPILEQERVDWMPQRPATRALPPGVNLKSFPSGISRAPMKITFPDRSEKDVFVVGGFLGVSLRSKDYALSPIINWAIVSKEA